MPRLPCDAAVVLGARIRPDGGPSAALQRRVTHAVRLYNEGLAPSLLLSGGGAVPAVPEARVMEALMVAAGIPAAAITLEARSRNTAENAQRCLPIIRRHGWRSVLLVTDAAHLPRALYAFRRLGIAAIGSSAGGDGVMARLREAAALPLTLWRIERYRAGSSPTG